MNTEQGGNATVDEEAAEAFIHRLHGEWSAELQSKLEARLCTDAAFADAYRRMTESWDDLDAHAESPQLLEHRQNAIAHARRAGAHRWLRPDAQGGFRRRIAAAAIGVTLLAAAAWQLSPFGYRPGLYRTGIGEQRMVELNDHSRIAVDASTQLKVRYSADSRTVELQHGQAQFSVAKDPARPFKVIAGAHTIVALGTVFTVEFDEGRMHVAMLEGQVAVVPSDPPTPGDLKPPAPEMKLSTGEEARVDSRGHATRVARADLEAATAWRAGKVIFRAETLGDAVRRLNRYSRTQIKVSDVPLAQQRISGVFEAGDTQAFLRAIERYLPVVARQTEADVIELQPQ